MASAKIKKGDNVVVLSGKDKGRTGTVAKVSPKDSKVIVSGLNVMTRHRKPSQQNPQGGLDRKAEDDGARRQQHRLDRRAGERGRDAAERDGRVDHGGRDVAGVRHRADDAE